MESRWVSVPQPGTMLAPDRSTAPRPRVAITIEKGGSPTSGRTTTRSRAMPKTAEARTARTKPGQKPSPRISAKV